jgi:hypothetical protein
LNQGKRIAIFVSDQNPVKNRKTRKGEIQFKGVTEPEIPEKPSTRFVQQSMKTNKISSRKDPKRSDPMKVQATKIHYLKGDPTKSGPIDELIFT